MRRSRPPHVPVEGTVPRVKASVAVRVFNRTAGALYRAGVGIPCLDESSLCAEAVRRTGLADFGDERFRSGMRQQLETYVTDPALTPLGRLLVHANTLRCLCNRLEIEHRIRENPQIAGLPIARPIAIVSLPRTGTTRLLNLLALDPASRPLRFWEALSPALSLRDERAGRDRRRPRAARMVTLARVLRPSFHSVHLPAPHDPEECLWLFQNTFAGPALGQRRLFEFAASMPRDVVARAYREYRRQLQLLQWQRPASGHWLLKCSDHLLTLDEFLQTLPGVRIVQIWRDPARAMASLCRLTAGVCEMFYADDRRREIGPDLLALFGNGLRRARRTMSQLPQNRLVTIDYDDLIANPVGVIRGIYDRFDQPFTQPFAQALQGRILSEQAPNRPPHYYELAPFGLARSDVEKALERIDNHGAPTAGSIQVGDRRQCVCR